MSACAQNKKQFLKIGFEKTCPNGKGQKPKVLESIKKLITYDKLQLCLTEPKSNTRNSRGPRLHRKIHAIHRSRGTKGATKPKLLSRFSPVCLPGAFPSPKWHRWLSLRHQHSLSSIVSCLLQWVEAFSSPIYMRKL